MEIFILFSGIIILVLWADNNFDEWGIKEGGSELIYIVGVLIIGYILRQLV